MHFPNWVETPAKQSKKKLASKRLKYLLHRAAIDSVEGGSIAKFARAVKIDRTSLHSFVRLGAFSENYAQAIEAFVGREHTRREYLTSPLSITSE